MQTAENSTNDITRILIRWNDGDKHALDSLIPLVQKELNLIAHRYLRRESPAHTLQTAALVNEAYIKMIDQNRARWNNRAHFFAVAAMIMRRILIEHARRNLRNKRGGGAVKVSLDEERVDISDERAADLVALDEALQRLALEDPQKARLVELRFFGGMSIEETAEVLGIGTATVNRQWRVVKAWLYNEISG